MAVPIEFASIILRKHAVDVEVHGGLDAISQADVPNWAEDEHLVRIGYMNMAEVSMFMDRFFPAGERAASVALVLSHEPTSPAWLSLGDVEGVPAAWLAGTKPGPVASPMGVSHLYLLRDGTAWPELMHTIAPGGVQAAPGPDERRVLMRGDASVDAWLIDRHDGKTVLMLAQKIGRRRWFKEDGELLRDILSTAVQLLDAERWS